ncbi:MAG: hypothetical protein LBR73_08600 [Oscillospiraceae bacterium]|jgi:hypothetical protein|nr:hypothetical protein [Oscillospiraceae bacterium]
MIHSVPKRILALFLGIALLFGWAVPSFAATDEAWEEGTPIPIEDVLPIIEAYNSSLYNPFLTTTLVFGEVGGQRLTCKPTLSAESLAIELNGFNIANPIALFSVSMLLFNRGDPMETVAEVQQNWENRNASGDYPSFLEPFLLWLLGALSKQLGSNLRFVFTKDALTICALDKGRIYTFGGWLYVPLREFVLYDEVMENTVEYGKIQGATEAPPVRAFEVVHDGKTYIAVDYEFTYNGGYVETKRWYLLDGAPVRVAFYSDGAFLRASTHLPAFVGNAADTEVVGTENFFDSLVLWPLLFLLVFAL